MTLRVSISGRAEADLTRQYQWYLDNAGFEVAERFLTEFNASVNMLAAHPGLGRRRRFRADELQGIRSYRVGGKFGVHLIFHRRDSVVLSIERVMHGARNLPRRLLEPPQD